MSFSEDEASAWKAFTDEDLLGGRSSSLRGEGTCQGEGRAKQRARRQVMEKQTYLNQAL